MSAKNPFFDFEDEESHYYYRYCPQCDERTFVRSEHPDSVEIEFCAVCGDGMNGERSVDASDAKQ